MVAQLSLKPKRLLTISQAAQFLGVTAVTLRYWEKKGYVLGTRNEGGIRKYKASVLREFIQSHPELISKTQDPEKSSIKKLQGHFLITTRFAILTSFTILVLGVAIGLNGQNLYRFTNKKTSSSNLIGSQSSVNSAIKAELAEPKDSLSQGLPEVKSFSTAGILVNLQPPDSSKLSDPSDLDENELDINTPMPVLVDQEIDCTLI